jgi:hypothetical protein
LNPVRKDRLHFRKLDYYTRNVTLRVMPRALFVARLPRLLDSLSDYSSEEILARVDYCNKLSEPFTVDKDAPPCRLKDVQSAYYFDFQRHLRYFPASVRYYFRFSDSTRIPERPTFLKARSISEANFNSVMLNLDSLRHFRFVRDEVPFDSKKPVAVFRGACKQQHRQYFLAQTAGLPCTDIGDTRKQATRPEFRRQYLTMDEQLSYKFIISVEGNDVATNLKWIMSSNSLCFMRRPMFETWFMEGRLEPGRHYVLLRDDYSDLSEKIDFYTRNTGEALAIIRAAHDHVNQFKDRKKERLVFLLVMAKYFALSGQLDSRRLSLPASLPWSR